MFVFLMLFVSVLLGQQADPGDRYFIDIADEAVQLHCQGCPPGVGQMYVVRPMQLKDMTDPKTDIQIETCHFTLVAPDVVQTAAHCARLWLRHDWQSQSQDQCGLSFAFYFPKTEGREMQKARCRKFLHEPRFDPSGQHTGPDSWRIQLDRSFPESWVVSEVRRPWQPGETMRIWGVADGEKEFKERSCRWVPDSILTPLQVLDAGGAFSTLSCDGDLGPGWSGAGVLQDGQMVANVSQARAQAKFAMATFGDNEIVVSRQDCVENLGRPGRGHCFVESRFFLSAVEEVFFESFDVALDWQELSLGLLKKNFPWASFQYEVDRAPLGLARRERFLRLKCINPEGPESNKPLVYEIRVETEKLHPKFVRFTPDGEVLGLYGVLAPEPQVGGFGIPLEFRRGAWQNSPSGAQIETLSGEILTVPFCQGDEGSL